MGRSAKALIWLLVVGCSSDEGEAIDDGMAPIDGDEACPDPGTPSRSADLVLGQGDFTTVERNSGGVSATSLAYPWGLATDGTRLWVGDELNARVLQWSQLPTANHEPADLVIGQAGFDAVEPGLTQTRLQAQAGVHVSVAGTRLVVTDSGNSRVLVWNQLPSVNGAAADVVVGQTAFDVRVDGEGAGNFAHPLGLWTDGTRLAVADWASHRVLIWNTLPTANGAPADVVLGWPAFDMGRFDEPASPPTASSLRHPDAVYSDGTRLFVVDSGNHRVLVWNSFPATSGAPADVVIGQSSLTEGDANGGQMCPTAAVFHHPTAVLVDAGKLYIADRNNHRVLVFDSIPTTAGAQADSVIGQLTFEAGDLAQPAAGRLNSPVGLAAAEGYLFVSQPYWNRVSRFPSE